MPRLCYTFVLHLYILVLYTLWDEGYLGYFVYMAY